MSQIEEISRTSPLSRAISLRAVNVGAYNGGRGEDDTASQPRKQPPMGTPYFHLNLFVLCSRTNKEKMLLDVLEPLLSKALIHLVVLEVPLYWKYRVLLHNVMK